MQALIGINDKQNRLVLLCAADFSGINGCKDQKRHGNRERNVHKSDWNRCWNYCAYNQSMVNLSNDLERTNAIWLHENAIVLVERLVVYVSTLAIDLFSWFKIIFIWIFISGFGCNWLHLLGCRLRVAIVHLNFV